MHCAVLLGLPWMSGFSEFLFTLYSPLHDANIWLEWRGGLFTHVSIVVSSFKLFQAMAARRAAKNRARTPLAVLAALWLVAADPCMILELPVVPHKALAEVSKIGNL